MTPYEAFKLYVALKQHFATDRYDYFLYKGMVRASLDSFLNRKDKHHFDKISRHCDPLHLMVSNFRYTDNYWIGDLNKEEAEKTFRKWFAFNNSLTYNFKNEISQLPIMKSCKVGEDGTPLLLKAYRQGKVSMETLILLDKFLGIFDNWDTKIQDTILWPSVKRKCLKYRPFIRYDKDKIAETLKKQLSDQEAYI